MTQPARRWFDLNTLLIRAVAFVALLSIPFKHLPHRVSGVEHLLPVSVAASHAASFFLALGLLYIANQVALRKLNAWYVAVALLGGLIAAELVHFRNPLQIAMYGITLTSIIRNRRQFVVRSDAVSFRRGLLVAAGLLAVVLLFATVVFEVIDQRAFGRDLTTGQTLSVTYSALTDGRLPPDVHPRRYDHMLLALLRLSALSCVAIVGWSLFRPLRLRRGSSAVYRDEARALLETYGQSSEDFFKLWPHDKHYFFYEQAFVAYGVSGNTAVVLDGASGDPQAYVETRQRFMEFARLNGWTVAVVHADPPEAEAWQQAGLSRLFIGSEAVVSLQEFADSTMRSKHFRYVTNRAAKDGLEFALWQPPLNPQQVSQLRRVSNAWLGHGGRREYGFMMACFERSYIGSCQVAVLQRQGEIVAYANLIPTFKPELASIDHMRFVPGLSSVSMHYLLRQLMLSLHSTGVRSCNLGLAPLSKLSEQLDKTAGERLLAAAKRLGSRYYSFEGLEQFKGKFEPDWEPRYLLYQGLPAKLIPALAALNSLSSVKPRRDRWRPYSIGLAVVAALAYCSFPLAYWLNQPLLWHGLASDLGQLDQPYAWLFNGLDTASSLIVIVLAAALYRRYRPKPRYLRWAVLALLLSNVGGLVAAAVSLPPGFRASQATFDSILQPAVLIHGVSSFGNSVGFVLAALLWGVCSRSRAGAGAKWRLAFALAILASSTLGAVIGYIVPDSSPLIQRLFIAMYGVWLVVFTAELTDHKHDTPSR